MERGAFNFFKSKANPWKDRLATELFGGAEERIYFVGNRARQLRCRSFPSVVLPMAQPESRCGFILPLKDIFNVLLLTIEAVNIHPQCNPIAANGGPHHSQGGRGMSVNPQRTFKSEYSPEELSTLAVAYETICDAARIRHASSIVRDLVATSVFQVASTGEQDPLRIVDCVMYKLEAKKIGARRDEALTRLTFCYHPTSSIPRSTLRCWRECHGSE